MKLTYRGTRVYPRQRNLLYNTAMTVVACLWVTGAAIAYWPLLKQINWKFISWPDVAALPWSWLPLIINSLCTALLFGVGLWAYRTWFADSYKKMEHRQKLARMIMENRWYQTDQSNNESFFKDLGSTHTKEKISHFPKIYYRLKDGLIHVSVEIVMSSYQDQLLHLEKKLEAGLYCELVDKILHDSYVEYTLLYDTVGKRITIADVTCEHGSMQLMETVAWHYDALPHMLIAGGTGGGKTYFILTLIEALLKDGAQLTILDPKNADLADLADVMPGVYSKKEAMLGALETFYQDMMARNDKMKQMSGYKTGENYAYLGLPAHFLIFDEYVAFMDMLGRDAMQVMSKLKQIVMLGRQAGFFLVLACQRPDAKYLGDGIRDQFMFRVALGRMSELGYSMMFGETNKDFFQKPIKGRGYVDTGGSVISEFYTPLVPRGYDFLTEIGAAANTVPATPTEQEVPNEH